MTFIFADILLHCLNIDTCALRGIADILCNKLPDIYDRSEGYRPLQHMKYLLRMDIPLGQDIGAVFLVAVIDSAESFVLGVQVFAQCRNFHRPALHDEAILRDRPGIGKIPLLHGSVAPAVKDASQGEKRSLQIVQKLTYNVTAEVFSPPAVFRVSVDIGTQISVQRTLRALICRLVEVSGIGFSQQHNLKSINDRRLACACFPGEEVNLAEFNQLFSVIQPVNQQDPRQLLHCPPPFSSGKPLCSVSHWIPRSGWSAKSQTGIPSDRIFR